MGENNKPKNIILCADGTGNQGGYTPDSNVYKVYKGVEKYLSDEEQEQFGVAEQVVFYDNGVGTNTNKYLRAISGGLGFGFGQNVRDLYKFLARNYNPGDEANGIPADRIYLFGFSRGASTIRAFNGFIHTCGLIDGRDRGLSNRDLDEKIDEAFNAYRWHGIKDKWQHKLMKWRWRNPGSRNSKQLKVKTAGESHGVIDIHFTGIWDTVVALGFPKRTDVVSPVSGAIKLVFDLFEKVADWLVPHSFYYYRLTSNQKHAYQALALDDERTGFWPFVWDEKNQPDENVVEQVWFAGMHSNVGGGYERSGLASVPLYWMIGKAQQHGLCFEDDKIESVRADSHVHGRMYDSRDGVAMFYRYHPREIEKLCKVKETGESRLKDEKIRIYDSIIERMEHRTANYAPCLIPGRFEVVKDEIQDDLTVATISRELNPASDSKWGDVSSEIQFSIRFKKILYDVMVLLTITIIVFAFAYWTDYPVNESRVGFMGHVADILDYILPDLFAGLIEEAVYKKPLWFWGALAIGGLYFWMGSRAQRAMSAYCQDKRRLIMNVSENRWVDSTVSASGIEKTIEASPEEGLETE